MDRFRLGSLALSFQVGFRFWFSCDLFWPLISSWLRTGGMLDEAGRTWQVTQEMELEWHGPGSNIIFQSSLHSYTIHVHLYTLIKLLSWAYTILRPCPIAALPVLDSKVTGTANCMGLGFESWWQPRNIESSELHEIPKANAILQTADKVAPAPFRLCFCHLTTRNSNIQIQIKGNLHAKGLTFSVGKEGLLVGLLVQHGFLDDFCFNVLHVEPWTNKNHRFVMSYFMLFSIEIHWIVSIPNPETWTLLVAPLSLPCQGEPA